MGRIRKLTPGGVAQRSFKRSSILLQLERTPMLTAQELTKRTGRSLKNVQRALTKLVQLEMIEGTGLRDDQYVRRYEDIDEEILSEMTDPDILKEFS